MPCRSEGYDLPPTPTVLKKDYDKLLAEHDKVTRILCGVIAQIRKGDLHKFLDEEGELWYKEHAELDKKRLEAERKAKRDAINAARSQLAEAKRKLAKLEGK